MEARITARWRTVAAALVGLPLSVFGSNSFLNVLPLPPSDDSPGSALLDAMRRGGFMSFIAGSHVINNNAEIWRRLSLDGQPVEAVRVRRPGA